MQAILSISLILFSITASAFPIAPFDALETEIVRDLGQSADYDFDGIAKLSNCSGSLVRFAGQPDTSAAYILTNGHCVLGPFLRPGEVIQHRQNSRRMKISSSSFRFHNVNVTELVYATMTDTDAALYRLKQNYIELESLGIQALEISPAHPLLNTQIQIISGYWERGYSCHIGDFVYTLKEGDWLFQDSIRYSQTGCEVIGGTSGSPIIERGTRTVVGVNNTGNESGRRCSMNNPCEIDRNDNVTVIKGAGYGQQTYLFYSCLTLDFNIDTTLPGCQLPK
jgi:V8-like Glu-specific endopeptidase